MLERERNPRVARILSRVFFILALSTTVESASVELASVITDRRNIGVGKYKVIVSDNLICLTEVLYYC